MNELHYIQMSSDILHILLRREGFKSAIEDTALALRQGTGLDAVGIRLKEGADYPFITHLGFSEEFVCKETGVLDTEVVGDACLRCTCGLVISGKTPEDTRLFTPGGSFWTNNAEIVLELMPNPDPRYKPKNHCPNLYRTIAIVPIGDGKTVRGLIQLYDTKENQLSLEKIEVIEGIGVHIAEAITKEKIAWELEKTTSLLQKTGRLAEVGGWQLDVKTKELEWTKETYRIHEVDESYKPTLEAGIRFYDPDGRAELEAAIEKAMQGIPFQLELQLTTAQGKNIWVRSTGEADFAGGKIRHISGTFQNITETRIAGKKLEVALAKARTAAAAKSEFLAVMSHELRTPLNGVLGFADLLGETKLDEDQKEYLRAIASSGAHLLEVVNDILDFSSIEKGTLTINKTNCNITELAENAVASAKQVVGEKPVKISIEISGKCPKELSGDERRIPQILLNLLGNAVKFTPAGTVSLKVDASPKEITFAVADSGIGIEPGTLPLLFQPFTQGDATRTRPFEGTGLGLAISDRLAQAMGGRISVVSTPGEGSEFTLHLPRNPESKPRQRILVAEDDPTNQLLIGHILKGLGYEATLTKNGEEAVEAFAPKEFGVILMDIRMPVMNGFEATGEIRKRETGTRVPIIALTANALPGHKDLCLKMGMDDYLSKPYKRAEIAAKLSKYCQDQTAEDQA